MVAFLKRSWLPRLWARNATSAAGQVQSDGVERDPLQAAGDALRQAREQRGLNLRQLALETRISTPVLEALERGWHDRLPETAYLRTMLPLLERHLQLERGSLRGALPEAEPLQQRRTKAGKRMPLLSVELFTTWQGTAVYGALMLALLYGLNLEQRRLAAAGWLTLVPLPPMSEASQRQVPAQGSDLLLEAHPELRPLTAAARGQALALLRRQAAVPRAQAAPPPETGVLTLRLGRPTQVQLQVSGSVRSQLQAGPGELVLPLTTPLQLRLEPAPADPQAVWWNDLPLLPEGPGRYRWPRPARAAISP